jgi:hypothetical protein
MPFQIVAPLHHMLSVCIAQFLCILAVSCHTLLLSMLQATATRWWMIYSLAAHDSGLLDVPRDVDSLFLTDK